MDALAAEASGWDGARAVVILLRSGQQLAGHLGDVTDEVISLGLAEGISADVRAADVVALFWSDDERPSQDGRAVAVAQPAPADLLAQVRAQLRSTP